MPAIDNLSEDQEAGLKVFREFMADPAAKTMTLMGSAGTGKTTLAQYCIKGLPNTATTAFTAPTNKATKVLRQMAYATNTPVDHVSTIYSLLGLRLSPTGEVKEIRRGGDSLAAAFNLICLDEASMAGKPLLAAMREDLEHLNTKVLKMGDPFQLPPVGEKCSEGFEGSDYNFELTKIVRQAEGNPIIQLTESIRKTIMEGNQLPTLKTAKGPDGEGVYLLPKAKWLSWMRAGFNSEAYVLDGDAFRSVAWRNITVNHYNDRIREALYGDKASEPFIIGERVFNAAPIIDELDEEAPTVPTDFDGVVRSVSTCTHPTSKVRGRGEYKVYHLSIWYEDVGMVSAYVPHPESLRDVEKKLKRYSAEARKDPRLWKTFWNFKDSFHEIRPAHAITSHRSQGSTYENVFLDVGDIMRNRNHTEALKSLYVGCSRASRNLMLLV